MIIDFLRRISGTSHSKGASFARHCSVCGYRGRFAAAGRPRRIDARCPRCGSAERYRLLALWLDRHGDFLRSADTLHFAPEAGLAKLLKTRVGRYRSADITPGRADVVLNIEKIAIPDASLDCVVCSHVLEHVDDEKALREIHRVLKPGGAVLIMLPIIEGWAVTYENPAVKTPRERMRHYGQSDHLRYYGADVRDRIRAAGFALEEFTAQGEDVLTYALQRGEKLFIARSRARGDTP
jgi:SAM-dependent methyltransferase